MLQRIQDFDIAVLNFINSYCHNPVLDRIMPLITYLGDMGFVWVIISVVLLANKKYRRTGIMVICALIMASLLGDGIIKNLIQRPRPCVDIPAFKLLIAKPLSYSFPSGHTATAFAATGVLAKAFEKYRIYIILLASMIAFSRMYLDVHYPTDIIGGIILGFFCSAMVNICSEKYLIGRE